MRGSECGTPAVSPSHRGVLATCLSMLGLLTAVTISVLPGTPRTTSKLPAPNRSRVSGWIRMTGGYVSSSPAVADGIVYVDSNDDEVYALNYGNCRS